MTRFRSRWEASSQRTKATAIGAATLAAAAAVSLPLALTGSGHPASANAARTGGTASITPAPSPSSTPTSVSQPVTGTPSETSDVSPLTGLPGSAGRVLAVKIDNVGQAQYQQVGLNSADVVYAIEVEGGLSRYLALYDSDHLPNQVGPVRSARQSDIPLLAAYGKVGLAYSGAISGLLPDLAKADLQTITPDNSSLFSHGGSMPTFIHPASVFDTYPNLAAARNVGFTFGSAPPGGMPADSASARMPAASFAFTAAGSSWLVSADGHPVQTTDQGRAQTTNVVIQHVSVVPGKYTDYNAGRPDNEVFSLTTGQGSADFYRDGQVWHGQWSKASDTSPTQYTVNGSPMALAPGRTWIVLEPS